MTQFPRCFIDVRWEYTGGGVSSYPSWTGGVNRVLEPMVTTLTLRGYFSVKHEDGYLFFKGEQGLGSCCLIDCTEDEMIRVQNFLETIRG